MKEKYLFVPPKPRFTNKVVDKKELKRLMAWAFSNYGTGRASYMADRLKELGFHYATRSGISLSVEDLRVPPTKRSLIKNNEFITTPSVKENVKHAYHLYTLLVDFKGIKKTRNQVMKELAKFNISEKHNY